MAYKILSQVLIDDEPVSASGWSITRSADDFSGKWQVDLVDPIVVSEASTVTITRGYDGITPATIIDSVHPDAWDGSLSPDNLSYSLSGNTHSLATPTSGPALDYYFVNSDYICQMVPRGSWTVYNDCLYYLNPVGRGVGARMRLEGLPDASKELGSFRTLVGTVSYHAIGRYLANLMGCEFRCNVPDLTVQRVLRVPAERSYFESISALFSLWNPLVQIIPNVQSGLRPIVQVLDAGGSEQPPTNPQKLSLSLTAIEEFKIVGPGESSSKIVDHVVVRGMPIYTWSIDMRTPDLRTKNVEAKTLSENKEVIYVMEFSRGIAGKAMGDSQKGFGPPGTPDRQRPKIVGKAEYYHIDVGDAGDWILCRELTETYTDIGLIHRVEVKNEFHEKEIVRTTEEEHALVKVPGQPFKEFKLVKRRIVDQTEVYDGLSRSAATEVVEELCVMWEAVDPKTGETYPPTAIPIVQAQTENRISESPASRAKLQELTTKLRTVTVDRVSRKMLRQITTDFDCLAETTKVSSQLMRDPNAKDGGPRGESPQEWHFYRDSAASGVLTSPTSGRAYNKAVIIECPDIPNQDIARLVASRALVRSSTKKKQFSMRVLAPLQLMDGCFSVTIPDLAVRVHTLAGSRDRTLSGGTYLCIGTTETLKISNNGAVDHSIDLSLRSVL